MQPINWLERGAHQYKRAVAQRVHVLHGARIYEQFRPLLYQQIQYLYLEYDMNALTVADLSTSQDLDRKALAAVIGGLSVCEITLDRVEIVNGPWGPWTGTVLGYSYVNGRLVRKDRWSRSRVQTEYSYWTYYYC
jgi:hypothetical protein